MATPSFYDKKHIGALFIQEQRINRIFYALIRAIAPQMAKWNDSGSSKVWVRNTAVEKKIEKELIAFQSLLEKEILNNTQEAWQYANLKNDDLVKSYIKGMALSDVAKQGLFARNLEALKVFQTQDFAISDKVWKITRQTKGHVELFLGSGIATGRAADEISRDFRHLLNNPSKIFRRVRDKNGKLVPSTPMKNYNPGRGVYRSAAMNAKRLAVTQKNMSYRLSDHKRWSEMDFVLGYEVKRSQNHEPCAICDAMKGKYPKYFIFPGWHPFCICYAVPILMNHEDFAYYLLDDEVPADKFVQNIPSSANKWLSDYEKKGNTPPLFSQMNEDFLGGKRNGVLRGKVTLTKSTKNQLNVFGGEDIKLTQQITKIENEIRMNKGFETAVLVNSKGEILIDKRGKATSVGFSNKECLKMKDCILTHNHPRGWGYKDNELGRIGNSFSKADLKLAVKYDIAEIRVVTPLYTFSMKRPLNGWNDIRQFDAYYDRINDELRKRLWSKINQKKLTVEKANVLHYHLLNKQLAKELGWEYVKKKTC